MELKHSLAFRHCYFWLFAFIGIWGTLLGPYLEGLGFSGKQVGYIIAAAPIASVFIPPLWGMLSDRLGSAIFPLRFALFSSTLLLFPLPWITTFEVMLPLYALFAMLRAGTAALLDSITLAVIDEKGGDYGRIRLFGSLGFVICGMGVAFLADATSDVIIVWGMLVAQGIAALSTLIIPKARRPKTKSYLKDVKTLFAQKGFALFIFTSFLAQVAMAGPLVFYPVYLKATGSSNAFVAAFWCVGSAAEIILLMYAAKLAPRFGWGKLYIVSIAALVVRFAPLLFTEAAIPVMALQVLHALTFGGFFYVSVHFARACAPPAVQASAQTFLIAFAFGLANGLGILISGFIYDESGIHGVLVFCLIFSFAAIAFALPTAKYMNATLSREAPAESH